MQKLYCFSHQDFNTYMVEHGWNDAYIPENVICISICNTNAEKYGVKHYFSNEHDNVLNINFDDIDPLTIDNNTIIKDEYGFPAHSLAYNQAKTIVDFIDKHINGDFYIHCAAGTSRSQGIIKYILDVYYNHKWEIREDNPPIFPNYHVVTSLKRYYRNKYEKFN